MGICILRSTLPTHLSPLIALRFTLHALSFPLSTLLTLETLISNLQLVTQNSKLVTQNSLTICVLEARVKKNQKFMRYIVLFN